VSDWFFGMLDKQVFGFTPNVIERTDDIDGLTVSTVEVDDALPDRYETAIIDTVNTIPVERYTTEQAAREGHARWVAEVPGMTRVTRIGISGLFDVEDTEMELRR
jgi:hypothetical protein